MKAGWQTSKLGEVLAVLRNGVNCKQDKSGNSDRISRIESISDASFDLGKVGYAELSERDKERYLLQPGDILFSHINSAVHVGKTALFESSEPVYHGVNLLLMRPTEAVTSAYLNHALKFLFQSGYWRGVCKQSVNQASVNQQDISKVEIRYPKTLPEQQRIVGLLDEAFDGIATAKTNADKNLQNARALFESHLQSVFTQRDKGWAETTLGKVCEFVGGSQPPKAVFSKSKNADNIRLIQIRDYKSDGHVVYIPRAQARRFCNADDVMIGRYGPPLFQIMRGLEGAYNVALMKAVPDESKLSRDFLFYFLKHSTILQYVIYHSERAAGQIGLTKETLEPYPIALPSLPVQQTVVETITELETETQRLASLYERKLAALDALKKSLLHQAFTGQL